MQSLGVVLLEAIAVLGVFTTSVYLRFDYCPVDFSNIQSKESFGNDGLKLNIPLKYFITDGF